MSPSDHASIDRAAVVLVDRRGPVTIVRLHRPEALNALSPEIIVRLCDIWGTLREDAETRVIIVTGSGDRAFSAGADLRLLVPLLSGRRPPENVWDERLLGDPEMVSEALLKTFDVQRPVIAAINGLAVGGGFELVQATDLRVMSDTAAVALQEVKWGLFPAGGSTVDLPRQLPPARAMEMLLTGEFMSAAEALHHGLVNRVVDFGSLEQSAIDLATRIADLSPVAVAAIRQSVRSLQGLPPAAAYAREMEIAKPVFETAEAAAGLHRFAQR
jgi:enoyl-CoA hydratase/carnithine racemase